MSLGTKNPYNSPSNIREGDIEKDILKYLNDVYGGYFWKNPTTGFFDIQKGTYRSGSGLKGTSDILGVKSGRFYAIEVKTPKNKSRPKHQKDFIGKVIVEGGIAFFTISVEDTKKQLEYFENLHNLLT